MYGANMIHKSDFSMLWGSKVRQVGDLFDCTVEPPKLHKCQELNSKYDTKVDFLSYNKIKTSINTAAKKINNKIFDPLKSYCKIP